MTNVSIYMGDPNFLKYLAYCAHARDKHYPGMMLSVFFRDVIGDGYDETLPIKITQGESSKPKKDQNGVSLKVYADREHSANLSWLTGFDPRFEEALFILVKAYDQMGLKELRDDADPVRRADAGVARAGESNGIGHVLHCGGLVTLYW